MPIETIKKDINGTTYETTQLGLTEARKTQILLTKKFGPSLAEMLSNGNKNAIKTTTEGSNSKVEINLSQIRDALQTLCADLDDATLQTLQNTFGKTSKVYLEGGKSLYLFPEIIEEHFHGGNMTEYYQWLYFCIEANYKDFFKMLGLSNNL